MLLLDWNNYNKHDRYEFYRNPVKFIKQVYPEYNSGDEIIFKNYITNDDSTTIYTFNDGDVISITDIGNILNKEPRNEWKSNNPAN